MLRFRPIDTERDAAVVIANRRDGFAVSFGNPDALGSEAGYLAFLERRQAEFPDGVALAYDGDVLVGQIELQMRESGRVGYVNFYYIMPEHRGHGYGRQLHEHVEQMFRDRGARRMELRVSPTNERALGFYDAMGFEVLYREDLVPPVLRMGKSLEPVSSRS